MADTNDIALNIQRFRERRGLSQAALAELVGVNKRQVGRWETGESEPGASMFASIADALGVSMAELIERQPTGPNLGGEWHYAGVSYKDGELRIDRNPVYIQQEGDYLVLAGDPAQPDAVTAGDYGWRGYLQLHRKTNSLIGGWESDEDAVNAAGAYFLNLHTQGTHAVGIWAGEDYDGPGIWGWCVLARTPELAEQQLAAIRASADADPNGNLRSWPATN